MNPILPSSPVFLKHLVSLACLFAQALQVWFSNSLLLRMNLHWCLSLSDTPIPSRLQNITKNSSDILSIGYLNPANPTPAGQEPWARLQVQGLSLPAHLSQTSVPACNAPASAILVFLVEETELSRAVSLGTCGAHAGGSRRLSAPLLL